jgi:DNA helicase HerA-like ATPase
MSIELSALGAADFQWTTHIDSVWHELPFHVPEFQAGACRELSDKLERLSVSRESASPLGMPLLGPAGAGKTHLLNSLRKAAFARGAFFVLVDMTDVSNFNETLLLGTLRSLSQPDADARSQAQALLELLILQYGDAALKAEGGRGFAAARPPGLITRCDRLVQAIRRRHPQEGAAHQDVVRALTLLCSDDFDIVDLGDGWLQGIGVAPDDAERHGFRMAQQKPALIYRGLSWLMSLARPTVLALDQLDAIVAEHNLASPADPGTELSDRQSLSLAIIQSLSGGLLALRDMSRRTQIVVSCLEVTWAILDGRSMVSMQDRFEAPTLLRPLSDPALLKRLVELRLAPAYAAAGFAPPYPCYPFRDEFFTELRGASPRELLKRCDAHRRECLRAQRLLETGQPPAAPARNDFAALERRFEELLGEAPVDQWLDDEDELALDRLIESACLALAEDENPAPADVDASVDLHFPGRGAYAALHARIRLVFRAERDRERHYAMRFLQKSQPRAFQSRLKAAITASGIESDLPFRRLAVLRVGPLPEGPASQELIAELTGRGGILLEPTPTELSTLWAVRALHEDEQHAPLLPAWLASKRPVSRLKVFKDAMQWLYGRHASSWPAQQELDNTRSRTPSYGTPMLTEKQPPSSKRKLTQPGLGKVVPGTPPLTLRPAPLSSRSLPPPGVGPLKPSLLPLPNSDAELPVGERIALGSTEESVSIPLSNLRKHALVLAGAGSGKTVLLKRLVEEAVLLGVPAIIVDSANDLSLLGDHWDSPPESWRAGDQEKAGLYHQRSEVVIWTPGIQSGNPLSFQALPDFSAHLHDADELEAALSMLLNSLAPLLLPGGAASKQLSLGVLTSALRHFATHGGRTLKELITLLSDLPREAHVGIDKADQIARKLGEQLLAETRLNPLLRATGTELDPVSLFRASTPGKTRVSVINLSGLHDESARQQFVGQLSMALFSYIKSHPARKDALLGLLVIDEAKDFVPSGRSVPGKDSLLRLVAQARKYGLGILFATQSPRSIDPQIVANCATQFYGRASSPAAIETAREQIGMRGGSGHDIAILTSGMFYTYTDGMQVPARVATRMCLSAHPQSPPDELEMMKRAARSRVV